MASAPTCSPRDQLGQVFLALGVGAVALDLVDAQVAVGAVAQADRGRRAADLLHRDHVGQVAHAGAAVFLADRDAEHAEGAHLGPQVHRKLVAAVDLGRARRDLGLRKLAHRVAQGIDVARRVESRVRAWGSWNVSLYSGGCRA